MDDWNCHMDKQARCTHHKCILPQTLFFSPRICGIVVRARLVYKFYFRFPVQTPPLGQIRCTNNVFAAAVLCFASHQPSVDRNGKEFDRSHVEQQCTLKFRLSNHRKQCKIRLLRNCNAWRGSSNLFVAIQFAMTSSDYKIYKIVKTKKTSRCCLKGLKKFLRTT